MSALIEWLAGDSPTVWIISGGVIAAVLLISWVWHWAEVLHRRHVKALIQSAYQPTPEEEADMCRRADLLIADLRADREVRVPGGDR